MGSLTTLQAQTSFTAGRIATLSAHWGPSRPSQVRPRVDSATGRSSVPEGSRSLQLTPDKQNVEPSLMDLESYTGSSGMSANIAIIERGDH